VMNSSNYDIIILLRLKFENTMEIQ